MNKIIKMSQIKRMTDLYMEIFEEEDNDYLDRRKIKPKERVIDRILNDITTNKEEQVLIFEIILEKHFFATTYKPICDDLRKIGYSIIEGE